MSRRKSFLPGIAAIRAGALLAAGLLGLASYTARGASWDVAELMALLAQNRDEHAFFTEKKFIALLDQPLESSGELFYRAPDHLEKRVLKPKPESFVLDGGVVTLEHKKRKHTLRLEDYPELAVFIESIRGILAGDRAALEASYRLALDGAREQWTLTLTPVDDRIRKISTNIVIHGREGRVLTVEIYQADGDHSIMTVESSPPP